MDIYQEAKRIIESNRYLSLATYSDEEIWATPLSYAVDSDYNFYLVTAIDSKHIEHITENPYVAFTIFDSAKKVSEIDGMQIKGIIGQVDIKELPKIVPMYYKHVFPDPVERKEWEVPFECFTKNDYPIYRFFQIKPTEIYKRDTINIDVDRRVTIDIDKLKEIK